MEVQRARKKKEESRKAGKPESRMKENFTSSLKVLREEHTPKLPACGRNERMLDLTMFFIVKVRMWSGSNAF
ncbi:hypothetical protein [Paenibacillus eucommiae]|uniref:Uncharacterized protein n=1 Tax=Paenibacillus eucommiae TaxID=1355755 RepID=A0ABS4J9L4_9BACL|nr:hypothetical protein [Paenibacillus eucommiae]MBP1996549.1 hypothetical protein [Paenibacillus eucommiae]